MKELLIAAIIIAWVYGLVLAKGFISTFFALVCPLWAFYLVVEKVMT